MGLMELPPVEPGRLIVTPHPALLDGQRNVVWEARAGESLYAILQRNVPEMDGQRWEVCIGGVPVERHLWHCVFPKQGQVIEVRGGVGKAALMVVAMIALTYFTFGIGTAAGWGAGAAAGAFGGGLAGAAFATGVFMAGSMLINKVLGPKPPKAGNQQQDSVYSISGARNQLRPYDPIPLLFGRVRITPDLLSKPYTWYEGNDQYLGLQLCAGINVGRIEDIYNGDTLLSSYDGVQVYHAGYSGMAEQDIPLYSNADTIDGAELEKSGAWVERTTSADTMRIQINLEYILGGQGTSGKNYDVSETIVSEYRVVGATNWMPLVTRTFRSSKFDVRRATLSRDVERGQYDVRVRMLGQGNYEGKNTQKNDFQWTQLTSVQADEADYTGLSRTGIRIKATGQLNGSPDELRGEAFAKPIPEWNGTAWVTKESSNPGAQCVAYARGISEGGRLLAGMQLSEDQIDLASWKAFTLHCAANGYTYDHYIKDARSHADVLSSIARAGFGEITWAGGRLGVVWAAQEQPLSGVVNMATIKKGQFQVDYTLVNAADGIEYTYLDSETWEAKTLRVPAPGVTTMLNPAQVSGEGVSTEQHAARMARWHLAQSLYQYKDISYSTDIEHLSYQRMSLLAMQHDMTQWGYGGRVQAAVNAAGTVTLTLDEPVPAPATGNAYIGVRIPGERVYRVLRVQSFVGESRTVTLADAWPGDAPLPGNTEANPAHDTLWIYDFKQTPGYRVRVTSIEPESDLKGASVRVVPEGPEFWDYVLNGHYVPAPNQSLLQTRPVASNLRVTEAQIVQGNTTFTELTATFDVTGPVGTTIIRAGIAGGELQDVAQTVTRTATWRINEPGQYTVVVRPYSPDGEAGIAVQATYTTAGAGTPPVLVDLFDVQERSGGVRLYTWGWLADTMQSPDFAGVEIRYIAGNVPTPDWEAMTPVGESGYYTAPFESVLPEAGEWTFACRSRNSSGALSTGMQVITRTLGQSLGQNLADITAEQVAQQQAIDQAVADALAADLKAAKALVLMGEEYDPASTYIAGDVVYSGGRMYRALGDVPMDSPPPAPLLWADVGTVTEAQAGTARAVSQLRVDVDEQGQQFAAAIDQVESDLASVTQTIRASGGGGNLISNSFFAADTAGWSVGWGQTSVNWERNWSGVNMPGAGVMLGVGTPAQGAVGQSYFSSPMSVDVRNKYIGSAYVASSGNFRAYVILIFYDAVGNELPSAPSPQGAVVFTDGGQWSDISLYERLSTPAVNPPAGAATCRIMIRGMGLGGGISAIGFTKAMVEQVADSQTLPSPWSAGGQEMSASHTVALDVNGYISGTQSINDGTRSSFSVLADVFRVIAPAGAQGMEWQNGYLRVYGSGWQRLIGYNFGVAADRLVDWFGPNVGAAAASRANGLQWSAVNSDGTPVAYFGGDILQGVIRGFNSNTTVSTTAEVSTGAVSRKNKTVAVTGRFQYQYRQSYPAFASHITLGGGTTGATIVLERRYGSGAWTELARLTLGGTDEVLNESDGPSVITQTTSGQIFATDVASATATEYRTRVVGRTLRQHSVTNPGNVPPEVQSQYQSIESLE